jgi:two-component system response regulator AlgR
MAQGIGQGKAMLNVMIVDDEPPARARLGQVLRDCSEQVSLQLVGEAEGGIQGLEEADRLHPDVILLDVHMPDMNGIEVARHLAQRENPPAVIFVTAYDEHALDAFEVGVGIRMLGVSAQLTLWNLRNDPLVLEHVYFAIHSP